MPAYSATLSSARAFDREGRLEEWIHLYLNGEGRNVPFSEGLRRDVRYYVSPARYPRRFFTRCAGPEPGMKFQIDPEGFALRVARLEEAFRRDSDMPPLIVNYLNGEFVLNDGNHRHKACENLGIETVWAIVWTMDQPSCEEFLRRYRDWAKDCAATRSRAQDWEKGGERT